MAIEREGIAVDITANVDSFLGGIGQAISGLSGFRVATAAAAGAAVAGFAVAGVKAFATYEAAMEQVRQKHRLTKDEIAGVGKELDRLQKSAGGARFSDVELANALNAVAQGSNSVGESLSVVEAALAFTSTQAQVSAGDLADNAAALSKILSVTGNDGDKAVEVIGKLRGAAYFSGLSMAELGEIVADNDVRAKNFSLTLDELISISAALGSKGQDPKFMFQKFGELQDPNSETTKRLREKLGVRTFDEVTGKLRPFKEIMEEIDVALRTTTGDIAEQGRILEYVFEDKAGQAIQVYRLNTLDLALAQDAVSSGAQQMAEDVGASSETAASNIAEAKRIWGDMLTALGEPLAGGFVDFVNGVKLLDEIFTRWGKKDGEGEPPTQEDLIKKANDAFDFQRLLTPNWLDWLIPDLDDERVADSWQVKIALAITRVGTWIGTKLLEAKWWLQGLPETISSGVNFGVNWLSDKVSGALATVKGWIATWVADATTWLANLPANIASGIGDIGAAIWAKMHAGLVSALNTYNAWVSQHGGILAGALKVNVPTAPPPVTAPPQAPSAAGGQTFVFQGDIKLDSVKDAQSFAREVQAMGRREAEFTSQYRSLGWNRGVVG